MSLVRKTYNQVITLKKKGADLPGDIRKGYSEEVTMKEKVEKFLWMGRGGV